jgi:hypothetical protein
MELALLILSAGENERSAVVWEATDRRLPQKAGQADFAKLTSFGRCGAGSEAERPGAPSSAK